MFEILTQSVQESRHTCEEGTHKINTSNQYLAIPKGTPDSASSTRVAGIAGSKALLFGP